MNPLIFEGTGYTSYGSSQKVPDLIFVGFQVLASLSEKAQQAKEVQQGQTKSLMGRNESLFSDFVDRIQATIGLKRGWDGYAADPPNLDARKIMYNVIHVAKEQNVYPRKLVASAEGGIFLSFEHNGIRANVESGNDKSLVFAYQEPGNRITIWETEPTPDELKRSLLKLRAVLYS